MGTARKAQPDMGKRAAYNLGGREEDYTFYTSVVRKERSRVVMIFGNSSITIPRTAAVDLWGQLSEILRED